ncbi:MAG: right-handed parallel beta-helix repeat-containing protein [Candidatus Hydrogenedentes bacterium]|nr:right-handed parallel beta-helix repeat-containing protein [Candidatus Hydrogenedentota bacterium]
MRRYLAVILALLTTVYAHAAIQPGPNAQEEIQEALITAKPGSTVELGAGTFDLTMGLSLDVDRVKLRGKGPDKTILSFKNQNAGSEGLIVTGSGAVLENFAVEDSKGDAIKTKGCKGITFRNVRTEWTGGPKETNGSYGFYPVESENVLIEKCVAIGASDAGIYVGQSKNVVVRKSRAEFNVAGIEIENCHGADVYECVATHNTGGILVFDMPDLPMQGGRDVRVFNNRIVDNDTQNFAPAGNIVATVPTGTGLMIMANNNVEVFDNTLSGNKTTNCLIVSYLASGKEIKDPNYDPYPEGIFIHNNTFGPCGNDPQGDLGGALSELVGKPVPDIVWDGVIDAKKLANGELPKELRIYIADNGDADFINFDLGNTLVDPAKAKVTRDIAAHAGELPRLKPIKLARR